MKKTAILCRTNAPLVKCAFALIRKGRGIKVKIVGKDVGIALKETIREIAGFRSNPNTRQFNEMLDRWIQDIFDRFGANESKEAYVSECSDIYGCLQAIAMQCNNVNQIYSTIDSYFVESDSLDDDPSVIIFASGHRSKGLEWDRVIWLRIDLCPHNSAKNAADLKQEDHLMYILPTRAKEELWICGDKDP